MNETVFFTPQEVADQLKIHRHTVIKLILNQKLSATIVGKQYRISQEQLDDYYRANTIQRRTTTQKG